LWAVIDAQRQELFAAKFDRQRKFVHETQVVTQADWLDSLQAGDFVTGPGLQQVTSTLPAGVHAVDESLWLPMAGAVGQIGWRDYRAGRRDDVWKLAPQYYRQSAAEEKAAQRPI
jgi:tRNA A37 threonylcarbamoyladenosine modification protein TsaB